MKNCPGGSSEIIKGAHWSLLSSFRIKYFIPLHLTIINIVLCTLSKNGLYTCTCICSDFVIQIVMVGPGTHLVKNHKSLSITNESQFKKKQGFLNWKCLGFFAGGKPFQLLVGYFTSVAKDLNFDYQEQIQPAGWELYSEASDYNSSRLTAWSCCLLLNW